MNKYNNILDIFPSSIMKDKINDLVVVIDDLSKRLPIISFNDARYEDFVFYKGLSYKDFSSWICTTSKEMGNLLLSEKTSFTDDSYKEQCNALIRLFDVLTVLWWKCFPNVATESRILLDNGKKTSLAGMVFKALETNLAEIGYPKQYFLAPKDLI